MFALHQKVDLRYIYLMKSFNNLGKDFRVDPQVVFPGDFSISITSRPIGMVWYTARDEITTAP